MGRVKHEEGEAKKKMVETLIRKMEKSTVIDRAAVLELAKATYWLLDRWCREHDNGKKKLSHEPKEELDLPIL